MTEAETEETLKQAWIDGWTAIHGPGPTFVPFTFDGEVDDATETWVRVSVMPSTRDQGTTGRVARFDTRGNIMVQLFGSIGVGALELAALAGDVRTVLERHRWGDVRTFAGATRKSPSDGRWEMRIVTVPYWVEEQR